jgi:hypothetical protein
VIPGIAFVRSFFLPSLAVSRAADSAPTQMLIGMHVLLAGAWWPDAPVASAMALIALGATGATIERVRSMSASHYITVVHLFVYLNLYLLFVGAVCHASVDGGGIRLASGLDLAISVIPMALVVRRSLAAMVGEARAR